MNKAPFVFLMFVYSSVSAELIRCYVRQIHSVISNDDLLLEILLRLPIIPLLSFKRVSKHWLRYGLFLFKSSRFLDKFNFDIIQSCNGLLLCSIGQYPYNEEIFVCNPLAHWSQMISERDLKIDQLAIVYVNVYSPETNAWSACPSNQPSHSKFNVNEHPALAQVQLPKLHRKLHWDIKMFATGGSLVLICWDYEPSNLLGIYEMKNGCADWLFKYFVDLNDVLRGFGKPYWRIRRNAMSIVLGEKEDDSFMAIELAGRLLSTNSSSRHFVRFVDWDHIIVLKVALSSLRHCRGSHVAVS
ncbi:granule-bound starch synthase [Tanacetum coccineum]